MHNAAGGQQMHTPAAGQDQVEWTILKTLNPYIILTGDFEVRDSVYYYKAFKGGQLYEWAVKDTAPCPKRDLYLKRTKGYVDKWESAPQGRSEASFRPAGGRALLGYTKHKTGRF